MQFSGLVGPVLLEGSRDFDIVQLIAEGGVGALVLVAVWLMQRAHTEQIKALSADHRDGMKEVAAEMKLVTEALTGLTAEVAELRGESTGGG